MKLYTLENRPSDMRRYRRKAITYLELIREPFQVETLEGVITISDETVVDWDGGYYLAYPDDGNKPYAIAPRFVHGNYIEVS